MIYKKYNFYPFATTAFNVLSQFLMPFNVSSCNAFNVLLQVFVKKKKMCLVKLRKYSEYSNSAK